jgi:fumarylacetoacetase
MKAIIDIPENSDFSIFNLPFGIFSTSSLTPRAGIRLGDYIIHIEELRVAGHLGEMEWKYENLFVGPFLNPMIEAGPDCWRTLRNRVQELFSGGENQITQKEKADRFLVPVEQATMHLPIQIGDYTDFYSSEYHAANVGAMFRDPQNPLLPNWKHIPVGYHGRSSSIVVSGTPFSRPKGQTKAHTAEIPVYGPSRQVDLELETAFIISRNTAMGQQIPVQEAEDYVFGMVLFNDWSARDLQAWEYVPLGPFLGKNFCSSVSPWVVTMDALAPFRTEMNENLTPEVLPYLKQSPRWTYDIRLQADMILSNGQRKTICKTNQKYLYWSMNQQLAHHTVNGCPMRVGDLLASGTISGPDSDSLGCLLEITKRGQEPVTFEDDSRRAFMEDGDSIVISGFAEKNGLRVGFGEVSGTCLPSV